jgi:hypothetical protein
MKLDHLGAPLRPMTRVQRKASSSVYRLDTEQGSFAVKELSLGRGFDHIDSAVFRSVLDGYVAGGGA